MAAKDEERIVAGGRNATAGSTRALMATALDFYRRGALADAERIYRQVIANAPDNADALLQLGMLSGNLGRFAEAEACLEKAALLRPAAPVCRSALGMLRAQQGRYTDAVACFDAALVLDSAYVHALVGRGDALRELGRLPAAEESYRAAVMAAPGVWEIRFGWAGALADLGHFDEAARVYAELLATCPQSAVAHFNLAGVFRNCGRTDEALHHYKAALAADTNFAPARVNLALMLHQLERPDEALATASEALRRHPEEAGARAAFATIAGVHAPKAYNADFCAGLQQCLAADDVRHEDLGRSATAQIGLKYGLAGALPAIEAAGSAAAQAALDAGAADGIFADRLLQLILTRTGIRDVRLEAFLTGARRRLLLARDLPLSLHRFVAALALQGFNNAYVFAIGDDEEARVTTEGAALEAALEGFVAPTAELESGLLRYALYAPLIGLNGAAALLRPAAADWSEPVRSVIETSLREPAAEIEISRTIRTLGAIADRTSRAVQAQYEEHPYPRWLSMAHIAPESFAVRMQRRFPGIDLPAFVWQPLEILVAGCGTGQEPIRTARSLRHARVLAVDLSRASLAYASRKAREFGVANVEFLQADILELGTLARQFAMIEALGVLHHMASPLEGWRRLTALLHSGGFMYVALYSTIARADVTAARARIAELGLRPVARNIRDFRRRILWGEEGPRLARLAHARDIYDLNGCRDLLFHASERTFTLDEVAGMLAELGLEFLGFDLDGGALQRYRAANPDDPAATDLRCWARFEEANPETFLGMYVFWCRKRG
ncbi:MAG TPA: tetratricopeptide repeat protein [Stellaceae bacterium]|nr:tetratricopeptide repeat protein [Stellaceae bacterium]